MCAVPRGDLVFNLFPFEETTGLHSSVCTNGYFCRFSLISSLGPQPETPVCSQSDAPPPRQAWIQL